MVEPDRSLSDMSYSSLRLCSFTFLIKYGVTSCRQTTSGPIVRHIFNISLYLSSFLKSSNQTFHVKTEMLDILVEVLKDLWKTEANMVMTFLGSTIAGQSQDGRSRRSVYESGCFCRCKEDFKHAIFRAPHLNSRFIRLKIWCLC